MPAESKILHTLVCAEFTVDSQSRQAHKLPGFSRESESCDLAFCCS